MHRIKYGWIEDAAKLMEDNKIRRLPILNRDRKLVGIVSLGDLATQAHDDKMSGKVLQQVSKPGKK